MTELELNYDMLLKSDGKMTIATFFAMLGRLLDYASGGISNANYYMYQSVWPWGTVSEYKKTMMQLQNLTHDIGPELHQDDSFAIFHEKLHTKFVEYVQEFVRIKNRCEYLMEQGQKNYVKHQIATWDPNTGNNESTQTFMENQSSLQEQYRKMKESIKLFFPLDEDDLKKILFVVFQLQRILRWGDVIENVKNRTAKTPCSGQCGIGFCKNVTNNSWLCKSCRTIRTSRQHSPRNEDMDSFDTSHREYTSNYRSGRWVGVVTNGVNYTSGDVNRLFEGVYTGKTYRCAERIHYGKSCTTPAMLNSPFCGFHDLWRLRGTRMTRENYEMKKMCELYILPELASTVVGYCHSL